MPNRALDFALGWYCFVCLVALTYPLYDWLGNRVEPFVFGLPFFFAYNAGWVILSFFVLLAYHLLRKHDT